MAHRFVSTAQKTNARMLRRNLTDAKRKLWSKLRYVQFHGLKFRRQLSISPYIVDFVCLKKRLIIEVDGGQHGEHLSQKKDQIRTAWLSKKGYRVLRFWNNDVLSNIEGVLSQIEYSLAALPPTQQPALKAQAVLPSPSRGEGNDSNIILENFEKTHDQFPPPLRGRVRVGGAKHSPIYS